MSISSASSAGCMRALIGFVAELQVGRERVGADLGPLGLAARARAPPGRRRDTPSPRRPGRRRCRCRGLRSRRPRSAASSRWRSRITSRTSGWRATTGTIRSTRTWRIAAVTSVPSMNTRPASSKVIGYSRASSPSAGPSPSGSAALEREPGERCGTSPRYRGSGSRAARRARAQRCSCRPRPGRRWRRSTLNHRARAGRRTRGSLSPTHSAPSIRTPSRETAPAIAPSIAIRWSPRRRSSRPAAARERRER